MITMRIFGKEVKLKDEEWTCKDKTVKAMLKKYNYKLLEGYIPFPDLALAAYVVKDFGNEGKITKVTGMPKTIKGRIY